MYTDVNPTNILPENMSSSVNDYQWVDLAGRPKWRRRVAVGQAWSVDVAGSETPSEREKNPAIAIVGRVFGHKLEENGEEVMWIKLDWLLRTDKRDSLGCPVYVRRNGGRNNKWLRIHTPACMLTPVHVLHRCRKECGVGLAGTVGYKATNGNNGENTRASHVVKLSDEFVLNTFYQR